MLDTVMQDLLTDGKGRFTAEKARPAQYSFGYDRANECIDTLTGVRITFPMYVNLPSVELAAITPISLLTVPASQAEKQEVKDSELVHGHLWNETYKLFGYDAAALKVSSAQFIGTVPRGVRTVCLAAIAGQQTSPTCTFGCGKRVVHNRGATVKERSMSCACQFAVACMTCGRVAALPATSSSNLYLSRLLHTGRFPVLHWSSTVYSKHHARSCHGQ